MRLPLGIPQDGRTKQPNWTRGGIDRELRANYAIRTAMPAVTQYQACRRPIEIVEWSGSGRSGSMPSRIQRKRTRGWRRPITGAYVGRPTKWGNPYKVGRGKHTAEEAVVLFRKDLLAGLLPFTVEDVRRELKGMDLMCWCEPGAPCHADLLLRIANGSRTSWTDMM